MLHSLGIVRLPKIFFSQTNIVLVIICCFAPMMYQAKALKIEVGPNRWFYYSHFTIFVRLRHIFKQSRFAGLEPYGGSMLSKASRLACQPTFEPLALAKRLSTLISKNCPLVKFRYSEKATKISLIFHFLFDITY